MPSSTIPKSLQEHVYNIFKKKIGKAEKGKYSSRMATHIVLIQIEENAFEEITTWG